MADTQALDEHQRKRQAAKAEMNRAARQYADIALARCIDPEISLADAGREYVQAAATFEALEQDWGKR